MIWKIILWKQQKVVAPKNQGTIRGGASLIPSMGKTCTPKMNYAISKFLGQRLRNCTMWKFSNFSATQILREINFGHIIAPKTAILTTLVALILNLCQFFPSEPKLISRKI